MKPIKLGVDRLAPANAMALHRGAAGRIADRPMAAYHECDLSRNATNGLGRNEGTKTYSPVAHSRNQWPATGSYKAPRRAPDGTFSKGY
jgi:hypothetical protein